MCCGQTIGAAVFGRGKNAIHPFPLASSTALCAATITLPTKRLWIGQGGRCAGTEPTAAAPPPHPPTDPHKGGIPCVCVHPPDALTAWVASPKNSPLCGEPRPYGFPPLLCPPALPLPTLWLGGYRARGRGSCDGEIGRRRRSKISLAGAANSPLISLRAPCDGLQHAGSEPLTLCSPRCSPNPQAD